MKRQQFPHGPDMIGDPGGHRWCYRLPSLAQTGMSRAKVIGRPDQIHRMVERECVTRQSPAAAGERGQALPKCRVEPLHRGRSAGTTARGCASPTVPRAASLPQTAPRTMRATTSEVAGTPADRHRVTLEPLLSPKLKQAAPTMICIRMATQRRRKKCEMTEEVGKKTLALAAQPFTLAPLKG